MAPANAAIVRDYHQRTKHHPHRYAASPGGLDWATQPDPFRHHAGARRIDLPLDPSPGPRFDELGRPGAVPPLPPGAAFVGRLFEDSLGLSAWKEQDGQRWALRINPSSGNLHPTEGWLISGPVPGLLAAPAVCHYRPDAHALEVRRDLAPEVWRELAATLPRDAVLVGLSSIPWREAWKYGERAFRYCQHDAGHAVAALACAAAVSGWRCRLLDGLTDDALARLLGLVEAGPEAEHPELLLVLWPGEEAPPASVRLSAAALRTLEAESPAGEPNGLSPQHREWPLLAAVARATRREAVGPVGEGIVPVFPAASPSLDARRLIHTRRSAVAMDGKSGLSLAAFLRLLRGTAPGALCCAALPWTPAVHLVLFVHRVDDLEPGVYLLPRRDGVPAVDALGGEPVDGTPLRRLHAGDVRRLAGGVSCGQAIAADGAFAVAMLAEFASVLDEWGPASYKRLFWEAGAIGQALYLEAEAAGLRGTGIGCFFDDLVHQALGIGDEGLQSLYHFTVGGPVEDLRLRTLAPYADRG